MGMNEKIAADSAVNGAKADAPEHTGPVVLYASSHGSTKRCAEWVAAALDGRLSSLNGGSADPAKLAKENVVVFGGWVNFSTVMGLKPLLTRFRSSGCPHLVVFALGIMKPSDERRELLIRKNIPSALRGKVDFFLLRGAMDRSFHCWAEDVRLRVLRIKLESKKNPTNEERDLWHAVTYPSDFTSPSAMVPVIEDARKYIKAR